MTDRITTEKRSQNMAAIKSRENKTTEKRLEKILRENKISGWRRHYKILGTPDFAFPKEKIAVFVDGCFWHGCSCKTIPKSNIEFWNNKITTNKKRDRRVNVELKGKGWNVVRIWEHQLKKNPEIVVRNIKAKFINSKL